MDKRPTDNSSIIIDEIMSEETGETYQTSSHMTTNRTFISIVKKHFVFDPSKQKPKTTNIARAVLLCFNLF